jgi:hypothetical protein
MSCGGLPATRVLARLTMHTSSPDLSHQTNPRMLTVLCLLPHCRRLSLDELRRASSNKGARKAYHAHLTPWPRPSDNPSAAAAAALAATLTAAKTADSMANGSIAAEAAATGHAAGVVGSTAAGNAGGTAAGGCALTPWDAQEFTDDELREQLRHVIGDVF